MQKTENSVNFNEKQTPKVSNRQALLNQKNKEMKVKLRQEIRQVFH